jgi:hypothetical protein
MIKKQITENKSNTFTLISIISTIITALLAGYLTFVTAKIQSSSNEKISQENKESTILAKKVESSSNEVIARGDQLVKKVDLYSNLIKDLTDPNASSFALLALWQLAETEKEKRVILATALMGGEHSINAIKALIDAGEDIEPQFRELIGKAQETGNKALINNIKKVGSFEDIIKETIENEGGYMNYPEDPGGEVYHGIARKIVTDKDWKGWGIIDKLKNDSNFPSNLEDSKELQLEVINYYKSNFWGKMKGDFIADPCLQKSLFDFSVNSGTSTSISVLQESLNAINNGKYPILDESGEMNKETLNAISIIQDQNQIKSLIIAFGLMKVKRYKEIVVKRPTSRKYFYVWVSRTLESVSCPD